MFTVDVSQLNTISADLGRLGVKATTAAITATAAAANRTLAYAKLAAPVDTGNLRNSISADIRGLTAEVGPTANYGRFVEEGTSRMAPQAYMGPAFDRVVPEYIQALEQAVDL